MTAAQGPGVLYHAPTLDARRGGIVVVSAGREIGPRVRDLCDSLAEEGYEAAAIGDADPAPVAGLSGPLFLLSLSLGEAEGEVGAGAWATICREGQPFAAASLYDPPLTALAAGEPQCPTTLHLTAERIGWPPHLDDLDDRRSDVCVFPYRAMGGFGLDDSDAARLARLRTLQLFHRSSGARGEMGG